MSCQFVKLKTYNESERNDKQSCAILMMSHTALFEKDNTIFVTSTNRENIIYHQNVTEWTVIVLNRSSERIMIELLTLILSSTCNQQITHINIVIAVITR